jgi:hypothetical protein
MFATTRLRLLGALVIMSALAALVTLVAFSPSAQANHSWNGYHWARTSNPFTLKLGDNVTLAWDSYLRTTATDWSTSSVLDTTIVAGKTNRSNCRPTSGRVEVCNYTYGANGWLGLAQVWISGKHIVQGTTKVNDTYFNRARYDNPNLGSCMDYTNDPNGGAGGASATDPSNEHPNQHDYEQLEAIYAHLDNTTTVGSTSAANTMPPAASQGNLNSRAEWGRQIHESPHGQLELYERDFGGGKKMYTFVIVA